MKAKRAFKIAGQSVLPGERRKLHLKIAALYDYTDLSIPVEVIRGELPGPTLFVSAAIHGDEIIGTEIIKRLSRKISSKNINGTLILIPVVNVFGFNNQSRYLPDRRDLNRCFPGSKNGSLASRLAYIFMKEVVEKCTHGIDLHTGAVHRSNLPQVRACLDEIETKILAKEFGAPVVMHSKLRDGSLREAARKKKVTTLLFEGGEALRFDEHVIKVGLRGCLAVMKKIGMLINTSEEVKRSVSNKVYLAKTSSWIRAPHSGSYRIKRKLGDRVKKGELLAVISNPFGVDRHDVVANESGIIIGLRMLPLVNRGDAIFHVACFKDSRRVKESIVMLDESTF